MRRFRFGKADQAWFYFTYFWYKLVLATEVRRPRWKMWKYEWAYSLAKFRDYEASLVWPYEDDLIETRFGVFRTRASTSDAAAVSPAFERRDINYLLSLVSRLLNAGKEVHFLDVGSDLGTYAVTLGNRFRDTDLRISAFEPVPPSCALLRENAELNNLSGHVEVHEVALMNRNDDDARIHLDVDTPGSSTTIAAGDGVPIRWRRLDDLDAFETSVGSVLVIKIDVEGAEQDVLEGAARVISQSPEVYLMIEDFIDASIIAYLEGSGWEFLTKRTTYNSWWRRVRAD